MSVSIGNITSATKMQFIALYQQQANDQPLQEFLEEYKSKQEIALKDAEQLRLSDVSALQIGEKLYKIVDKANKVYAVSFKKYEVNVEEEGRFMVSGLGLCEMGYDPCSLCDHEISGSTTYTIKNLNTNEEITFRELTMHLIRTHGYFAKSENYRLDPAKTCRVLELNKANTL